MKKIQLCGKRQSLTHLFVTCSGARLFGSLFTNWWNFKTEIRSLSIKMKNRLANNCNRCEYTVGFTPHLWIRYNQFYSANFRHACDLSNNTRGYIRFIRNYRHLANAFVSRIFNISGLLLFVSNRLAWTVAILSPAQLLTKPGRLWARDWHCRLLELIKKITRQIINLLLTILMAIFLLYC